MCCVSIPYGFNEMVMGDLREEVVDDMGAYVMVDAVEHPVITVQRR